MHCFLYNFWLIFAVLFSINDAIATDVNLHGTLIESLPCTIKPGSENREVSLGPISDKYLYKNQRTIGRSFQLFLEGCDTKKTQSMTMVFSGQENPKLPGLLALTPNSQAKGIGIGLETMLGKKLPLDIRSDDIALNDGENIIPLRAYVAAEEEAISQRTITLGYFSAIATFKFTYN